MSTTPLPATLERLTEHPFAFLISLLGLYTVSYVVYYRYLHPLSSYPGPLVCSLTNFHKLWSTWTDCVPEEMVRLHKLYGNVVRIGPNDLSFDEPQAIDGIYKRGWRKGYFYTGFDQKNPGLFSERNEAKHAKRKRMFGANFSMTSIREYEHINDSRYAILRTQLDRFSQTQEVFDLRKYITYTIVDILGSLAFSEPFGNQHAEDPKKIPRIQEVIWASCVAGSVPWLAPVFEWLKAHLPPSAEALEVIRGRQIIGRLASENITRRLKEEDETPDILGKIIAAAEEGSGKKLSFQEIMTESITLIVGGTHTTGNTLHLLFANLSRHEEALRRCVEEIDRALPPLAAHEACYKITGLEEKLDFVNTCILENFRKDSVATFNMPRIVPSSGATIAGHFVPGGTQVSANTCALHHNPATWGQDHERFDPDRWYDEKRAKGLERFVIPFSVGKRSCVGQNLATANILKMVTTLLRCYEFEFVNKEEEMVVASHGDGYLRTPVMVKVKMRDGPYAGAVPDK